MNFGLCQPFLASLPSLFLCPLGPDEGHGRILFGYARYYGNQGGILEVSE